MMATVNNSGSLVSGSHQVHSPSTQHGQWQWERCRVFSLLPMNGCVQGQRKCQNNAAHDQCQRFPTRSPPAARRTGHRIHSRRLGPLNAETQQAKQWSLLGEQLEWHYTSTLIAMNRSVHGNMLTNWKPSAADSTLAADNEGMKGNSQDQRLYRTALTEVIFQRFSNFKKQTVGM